MTRMSESTGADTEPNATPTPIPWTVKDECGEGLDRILILGPTDARSTHRHGHALVLEMRGWLQDVPADHPQSYEAVRADAALIVRAVNLHDELLAAARDLYAFMQAMRAASGAPPEHEVLRAIRVALAKADELL